MSATLTVLPLHNFESVYFFYSKPVFGYHCVSGITEEVDGISVMSMKGCHLRPYSSSGGHYLLSNI